jgi:Uma2 family endonuclease
MIIGLDTSHFHMNEDDFFQFCAQHENLNIERDSKGQIIIMSPSGSNSGRIHMVLYKFFSNWNDDKNMGYLFDASAGFTLPNNSVRSPDLAWIRKELFDRLPDSDKETFAHICPDFVIEVRSKTDSIKDLRDKMVEYIENGTRLGWLIDTKEEFVEIYAPNREVITVKGFNNIVSGEDVLPGFELKLSSLRI